MMSAAMAPRKPHSEEMLSLLERHKIKVLLDAEFSAADVSTRTGFSIDAEPPGVSQRLDYAKPATIAGVLWVR